MIYLDVTGACRLRLQTGIPRTTRAIYALLEKEGVAVTPMVWQPFLHSYTELSSQVRELLENPLDSAENRSGESPRDDVIPFLKACLCDLMLGRPKRISLPREMGSSDVLLITSMIPDNRVEFLRGVTGVGKRIAIFHDAIQIMDPNIRGWKKGRLMAALRLFAKMDLVICVSEAAEEDLRRLWCESGIKRADTCVLTWPVPFFESRPTWSAPPLGVPSLLTVARLKKTKNHKTLFAACEELWGEGIKFSLDLIGCRDLHQESLEIVSMIGQLQERGRTVRWRGHVSDDELHRAYQECSFTVFPSLREGVGLPILESLWHGRAVICSLERPMSDVGRGPGCLLVDAESPASLASAMRLLLLNQEENLRLAKEAFGRSLRTWEDYARQILPIMNPDFGP